MNVRTKSGLLGLHVFDVAVVMLLQDKRRNAFDSGMARPPLADEFASCNLLVRISPQCHALVRFEHCFAVELVMQSYLVLACDVLRRR